MKRTLVVALLMLPAVVFAQKKNKKHKEPAASPYPRVWLGTIYSYYTTKDSILANPVMYTDSVGCRVSGFTVSLQGPGHPYYGPLYSTTWEMTQAQKDAIKQADYPEVTLYIADIHLNCHEKDAITNPFSLVFNHQR